MADLEAAGRLAMPAPREWITRPAADRRSLEAQDWHYHGYATAMSPQGAPRPMVVMWRPMVAEAEAA